MIKKENGNTATATEEPKVIVRDRRFWVDKDVVPTDVKKLEESVPTYLENLKRQLEQKDLKLKDVIDSLKEEQENFKKRVQRDIDNRVDQTKMKLIAGLIPALDNLGRAIEAAEKAHNFESLMEGIKMVLVQFRNSLRECGAEEIVETGRPFDPKTDEAVQIEGVKEKEKDNQVLVCLAPGYRLGDKIIRPAQVKIGRVQS